MKDAFGYTKIDETPSIVLRKKREKLHKIGMFSFFCAISTLTLGLLLMIFTWKIGEMFVFAGIFYLILGIGLVLKRELWSIIIYLKEKK